MLKQFINIIVALTGMVLLLPAITLFWVLAKLTRPGSGFKSYRRIGKDLTIFNMYRYKIKKRPAKSEQHPPRGFLRRRLSRLVDMMVYFKLDRWPILINVLKGEMSIVGPRPELPEFLVNYSTAQKEIFSVRPGIWRPDSYQYELEEEDICINMSKGWKEDYVKYILPAKIKAELAYVRSRRLGKDLKIFWQSSKIKARRSLLEQINDTNRNYNFMLPLDVILISLSYFLAYQLRFELGLPQDEWSLFWSCLPIVLALRVTSFYYFGIYRNLWKYVNIRDLITIIKACSTSGLLIVASLSLMGFMGHSRTIFLIDWVISISLIGGSRMLMRFFNETVNFSTHRRNNVLIIGIGDVGVMVLKMLDISGRDKFNIVGFISDDSNMLSRTVQGYKVLGSCSDIPELAPIFRIDEVLIAEPSMSSDNMKDVIKYCKQANLRHRIVPAVNDLLSGSVHLSPFREVEISDLFGRQAVKLDLSAIKNHLKGKRVLVTGAGGSIGSELCRQIVEYHPQYLLLIDKNENYLHEIQSELGAQHPNLRLHASLSSITNEQKLRKVFEEFQPELIFHAAAHKHVPLSEVHVEEAIWNNIVGTRLLANVANEFGVESFVMVSTDKAVNPTSVMGVTKRIAEIYVQAIGLKSNTRFVTVRFGNVLNSNGSVIPIFRKQIEKGGPVTITHPEVERYFMSIFEAVQLILQAFTMGKAGEIFVLEMGKSIRIMEMAIELISQAGFRPFEDIAIEIVGLRPGEKLYEELIGKSEESVPTSHNSIKTLRSKRTIDLESLEDQIVDLIRFTQHGKAAEIAMKLQEIVPEYTYTPNTKPAVNWRYIKQVTSGDQQTQASNILKSSNSILKTNN